jgi:uncharacterized protein YkwD
MRFLGNILIILFVVVSIYALRDDLQPVANKLGTIAHQVVLSVENASKESQSLLPQDTNTPKSEIHTPGPLNTLDPISSPSKTPITQTKPTATTPTPDTKGLTNNSIIYWTNQARKDNGNLAALTENSTLDGTALAKANDMFDKQYFEHTSPSGVTVATQMDAAGYGYIIIGENLALGDFASGKEIVDAWMNSPGHRANILQTHYKEIGVAVKKGTYQGRTVWIAVQHFGLSRDLCPAVNASLKPTIDINETHIKNLQADIDTRKQAIDGADNQFTAEYDKMVNEYNALVRDYNALVADTKTEIAQYNQTVEAYNTCIKTLQGN